MESWEEQQKARLRARFPAWEIWYVRHATVRRHTWCARPYGAPAAVFHSDSPEGLAVKLARTGNPNLGFPG